MDLGPDPVLGGYDTRDDHDQALVLSQTEVAERADVSPGDLAVLFPTNALVREYEATIRELGMATQRLEKCDGNLTWAGWVQRRPQLLGEADDA